MPHKTTSCLHGPQSLHTESNPCWVARGQLLWCKAKCGVSSLGNASSPWGTCGSTYVNLWRYPAWRSSLLHAQRSGNVVSMSKSRCGGQMVRSHTSAFVTWSVYGIRRIHWRQMLSKAVILSFVLRPMFQNHREGLVECKHDIAEF